LQFKRGTHSASSTPGPWSPAIILIIALFLLPGAAVLTVRNCQRLQLIDGVRARELIIAVIFMFAVGLAALILVAPLDKQGVPQLNSNASIFLTVSIAAICYGVQRKAYREWRAKHASMPPAPWLSGIGTAALYTFLTFLVTIPVVGVATLLNQASPS